MQKPIKPTGFSKQSSGTGGNAAAIFAIGLALSAGPASAMQVFVSFAPGRISGFEVEPNDTILNLKIKIQDRSGFAPGDQFLYKSGTLLEEDRTLADYFILKESLLSSHVVDTLSVAAFSPIAGNLDLPIKDAASGPGEGWMTLSYDGAVDLSTLSPGVHAISLFSYAGSAAGSIDLFDPAQSFSWTFLTSNTGVSGFDPGMFSVDTSHFMNAFDGTFSVVQNGPGSLAVAYYGVPEPTVSVAGALGFGVLLGRRKRK